MNKYIELLSPAGDLERLKTAVRFGANAVYIGGKKFSLRSRASNFDIDDIREGVEFVSLMKEVDGKGVITCTGAGKTFNLAQLRPGLGLVMDEELILPYKKAVGLRQVNDFKMYAHIAAYTESDDWVEQMTDYINGNIDAAREFLAQRMPKVKCPKPEGTYLLWMDFSAYGLSDEELMRRIYDKAWVILEEGARFGEGNEGWMRMTMSAPRPRIMEALERIAKEFE